MKLYERFGDTGFHTTVISTFGIDFDAFESIALPRLRGAGCYNVMLVSDARMLTHALDGGSVLPRRAGRYYTVSGASASGVFHPKMILQLGRQGGRLIVGSANMTAPGLAGNLELAGLISCTRDTPGEQRLVAAAWEYLARALDRSLHTVANQLEWTRGRTPWLANVLPAAGRGVLADGTAAALLTSSDREGIGTRFSRLVEERPVNRLIVLSPYWDNDLTALQDLTAQLQPREVLLLIDSSKGLFPGDALRNLPDAKLFDLAQFGRGRFIHAKAVIAQTADADHVLYGSANCTVAALGTDRSRGRNEEVCLYRRVPPNRIVEGLGLNEVLSGSSPLRAAALPPLDVEHTLPLELASARFPGRFECLFHTLFWWPPHALVSESSEIELLGGDGRPLAAGLSPLDGSAGDAVRFAITALKEQPSFARLRFADGSHSAPAVIGLVDALREAVREKRSRRVEAAAQQLSEETEEGIWLLEILDTLEAAEAAHSEGTDRARPPIKRKDRSDSGAFRTLKYEEFLAGRRLRSEQALPRNSLAGSEVSLVRGFLNRILSVTDTQDDASNPDNGDQIARALGKVDETADGASAIEDGGEFPPKDAPPREPTEAEKQRKIVARARATRDDIVEAM